MHVSNQPCSKGPCSKGRGLFYSSKSPPLPPPRDCPLIHVANSAARWLKKSKRQGTARHVPAAMRAEAARAPIAVRGCSAPALRVLAAPSKPRGGEAGARPAGRCPRTCASGAFATSARPGDARRPRKQAWEKFPRARPRNAARPARPQKPLVGFWLSRGLPFRAPPPEKRGEQQQPRKFRGAPACKGRNFLPAGKRKRAARKAEPGWGRRPLGGGAPLPACLATPLPWPFWSGEGRGGEGAAAAGAAPEGALQRRGLTAPAAGAPGRQRGAGDLLGNPRPLRATGAAAGSASPGAGCKLSRGGTKGTPSRALRSLAEPQPDNMLD